MSATPSSTATTNQTDTHTSIIEGGVNTPLIATTVDSANSPYYSCDRSASFAQPGPFWGVYTDDPSRNLASLQGEIAQAHTELQTVCSEIIRASRDESETEGHSQAQETLATSVQLTQDALQSFFSLSRRNVSDSAQEQLAGRQFDTTSACSDRSEQASEMTRIANVISGQATRATARAWSLAVSLDDSRVPVRANGHVRARPRACDPESSLTARIYCTQERLVSKVQIAAQAARIYAKQDEEIITNARNGDPTNVTWDVAKDRLLQAGVNASRTVAPESDDDLIRRFDELLETSLRLDEMSGGYWGLARSDNQFGRSGWEPRDFWY